MKTNHFLLLGVLFVSTISFYSFRQVAGEEPWTEYQLMAPADLARIINDPQVQKAKSPKNNLKK